MISEVLVLHLQSNMFRNQHTLVVILSVVEDLFVQALLADSKCLTVQGFPEPPM